VWTCSQTPTPEAVRTERAARETRIDTKLRLRVLFQLE
jgi:hypothetical protein